MTEPQQQEPGFNGKALALRPLTDLILMALTSIGGGAVLLFTHTHKFSAVLAYLTNDRFILAATLTGCFAGAVGFISTFMAEWHTRTVRNGRRTAVATLIVYVCTGLFLSTLLQANGYYIGDGLLGTLAACILFGPALAPLGYRYIGMKKWTPENTHRELSTPPVRTRDTRRPPR